jgi:hypothetical protein
VSPDEMTPDARAFLAWQYRDEDMGDRLTLEESARLVHRVRWEGAILPIMDAVEAVE